MVLQPSKNSSIILEGNFNFSAHPKGKHEISDSYMLRIVVPSSFPLNIPEVIELGQKIPRNGDYHVNFSANNTLCLGSPLRLLTLIRLKPTIIGYAENCLVPYLYAVSYKLQNGGDFIFGDLEHGTPGIIEDYKQLFGLKSRWQVIQMLRLLSTRRQYANRAKCPCGCIKRLKQCRFHKTLNAWRKLAPIPWFRHHFESLNVRHSVKRRG